MLLAPSFFFFFFSSRRRHTRYWRDWSSDVCSSDLGGRVGLLTSSASGKAKRLRNNPSATLQPSYVRGRAKSGTTPVTGTVELVTSGPDFEAITSKVKAKYGLMVP